MSENRAAKGLHLASVGVQLAALKQPFLELRCSMAIFRNGERGSRLTDKISNEFLSTMSGATFPHPPPCSQCHGEMREITRVAPAALYPEGLIAYECSRCGHVTSVLIPFF